MRALAGNVQINEKEMTEKYEILQDLCEAFDNFSESERKLNLSERARSADSGAFFGFKIEER